MENRPEFEDKQLVCCHCGKTFTWEAGEQAYFWSKELSQPRRCPSCRRARKVTLIPDSGVRHG